MKKANEVVPFELHQLDALQALAIRTFTNAYASQNEARHIEEHIDQSFSLQALKADVSDPSGKYLVAREPNQQVLLGYVKLGTRRTHESVEASSAIEIERIYVDTDSIGMGVGAALMATCIDFAQKQEHDVLWLGVWQNNQRAVNFYERWGFEICGEQIFNMGSDPQPDFVMAKRIA